MGPTGPGKTILAKSYEGTDRIGVSFTGERTKPLSIFLLKSISLSVSEARKGFITEICYARGGNAWRQQSTENYHLIDSGRNGIVPQRSSFSQ